MKTVSSILRVSLAPFRDTVDSAREALNAERARLADAFEAVAKPAPRALIRHKGLVTCAICEEKRPAGRDYFTVSGTWECFSCVNKPVAE